MPESRVRKSAAEKKKQAGRSESSASKGKSEAPGSRAWVPPTFITVGLLGVIWLVVYYMTASASIVVPGMTALGGWNILIGMGAMAAAFALATLWK